VLLLPFVRFRTLAERDHNGFDHTFVPASNCCRPISAKKSSPKATHLSSSNSLDEARFVPGTTLAGRYRIVGLLGRGGMGEVYRTDDLKLGQAVALKFLPEGWSQDGAALARFHREVRLARQVSHPNVCRVFDIGEAEGRTFLTMEYVDGEDLASLLRRIGRLPSDKALEIARQLCAGLAAAQEHGLVHRDLKPANIMLDGRGRVRITDFGLAARAGEDGERTGTPAYMAPEQLSGGEVTPKSDMYSLGLVLYEIFTGKRAFEATTLAEMLRLRNRSAPTHPSQIVKDIDPLVERVILRCLEKNRRSVLPRRCNLQQRFRAATHSRQPWRQAKRPRRRWWPLREAKAGYNLGPPGCFFPEHCSPCVRSSRWRRMVPSWVSPQ